MLKTLRDVRSAIGPKVPCRFNGDGHIFTFIRTDADGYQNAQLLAARMMAQPASIRPRGWSRGINADGSLFVCIRLH